MVRGFFGGTFNPFHMGHYRLASAAVEQLALDRLCLIPTGDPPHKTLPPGSPDSQARLEMVRLAADGLERAVVLDWEVRRSGPSYTADTVERLLAEDPAGELWLICSTDMFLTLPDWYRGDWLLRTVSVAANTRKVGEDGAVRGAAEDYLRHFGTKVRLLELEPLELSSTGLREKLPRGQGGRELPEAVYRYILRHRLYEVRPEPAVLWELVQPLYAPRRLSHVQGCRQEAVRLARRWGADVLDAENAAILHDITKQMPQTEQLQICTECGIIPPNFTDAFSSVLHAFSGAALAETYFGVSPAVREAIRWHTTGKADMSLLEKLIWLADGIEPSRSYPGVDAVRELAYRDLDGALCLAMTQNLRSIRARGLTPHPATGEALRALCGADRNGGIQ